MGSDRSPLLVSLEKRLGRELTPSEVHLILLAEEIVETERHKPDTDSKAAGAE